MQTIYTLGNGEQVETIRGGVDNLNGGKITQREEGQSSDTRGKLAFKIKQEVTRQETQTKLNRT